MSITTKLGDDGRTGLVGGERVSKSDPRVECCGTIDELVAQLGFARSICRDTEIRVRVEELQRALFRVASAVATPARLAAAAPPIDGELADGVEAEIHRIEAMQEIRVGWAIPGGVPDASALDVARTVCRRAERLAAGLMEQGQLENPAILAFLNRTSDLLWLLGRLAEARAGADAPLPT